ncbi:hypothetical protein P4O66_003822 [Electrophorus voltai]|uniref:Uncharacterized protein n=1 Tax=Electrophorus voltai TaxID=2609070 RepID=A0AAD8ZR31_9TELE|nr:hypothetical protein P4O66_003822 [Electrophorus voltai]
MAPAELQAKYTKQEGIITDLGRILQRLTGVQSSVSAKAGFSGVAVFNPGVVPVAFPERYDGSPDLCQNFLMQCSMVNLIQAKYLEVEEGFEHVTYMTMPRPADISLLRTSASGPIQPNYISINMVNFEEC